MAVNSIDAVQVSRMFLAGARYLENQKDHINELNVFPVPDGDTGTNMTATIMSAAQAVSAIKDPDMKTLSKAISSGSLRGARGNSGVILSQLFRGFTKVMKTVDAIDANVLAEGMQKATETAYRAVMKPKEGTILTVAKAASDAAVDAAEQTDDLIEIGERIVDAATAALESTPELLPVLKEAGVVDSGGSGLLEVLKGAYDYLCGKDIDITIEEEKPDEAEIEKEEEVKFTYSVAFSVKAPERFAAGVDSDLSAYLSGIGEEVKLTSDSETMKISLLTNEPGKAINHAIKLGEAYDIHITNVKLDGKTPAPSAPKQQSEEEKQPENSWKEIGFVAVSCGEGLDSIFKELEENKRKLVTPLIEKAAFMSVELDALQEIIEQDGWTSEYKNGENQYGTKRSPEADTYIALSKNYAAVIKQLVDIVPEAKRKQTRLAALRDE